MMTQILNDQERRKLNQRISKAEKVTGAQIVLAVVKRSDSYPEIPWKAFAMGVSFAGLVVFLLDLVFSTWIPRTTLLITAISATFFVGILFALLTVGITGLARLFLTENRSQEEVRQYAESVFLDRGLFATSQRTGILVLVSMFERQVIIFPDTGLQEFLSRETIEEIISGMAPILVSGDVALALEEGLNGLEKILEGRIEVGSRPNGLANEIIEERGA
jgi:putative membrane protein